MIHTEQGFNPRETIEDKPLQELADSIRNNGLLTALTVVEVRDPAAENVVTGYKLVAGHRRLMALDIVTEGEYTVPAVVTETEDHSAAIIENVVRVDLTPVEEALAFKVQIDNHGLTPRGVAEKLGVDLKRVNARLEILRLPKVAIDFLQQGKLTPSTVKPLLKMAKASPELAIEAAAACAGKEHWLGILAKDPGTIASRLEGLEKSAVLGTGYIHTERLIKAFKRCEVELPSGLAVGMRAFDTEHYPTSWDIPFDAAVGSGEAYVPDPKTQKAYFTELAWLVPLIQKQVAEREQSRAMQAKAEVERKLKAKGIDPTATEDDQEAQKAALAEAQKAERAAQLTKRSKNLRLGANLLTTEFSRSSDTVIRMLCFELLAALSLGHVAKQGWRLIAEACQKVETKKVKSTGAESTRVGYLSTIGECQKVVEEFVAGAKTADELLHRTVTVVLAAEGALQSAVSESNRVTGHLANNEARLERRKLLEAVIDDPEHLAELREVWEENDKRISSYSLAAGVE